MKEYEDSTTPFKRWEECPEFGLRAAHWHERQALSSNGDKEARELDESGHRLPAKETFPPATLQVLLENCANKVNIRPLDADCLQAIFT